MARGTDPLNDPRWEGQDSVSLPDRPAHPDPSRVAEHTDVEEAPVHGIYGHRDKKHGLADEKAVREALKADADDAEALPGANELAKAILDGEQVASIEAAKKESGDGKRKDSKPGNAPVEGK